MVFVGNHSPIRVSFKCSEYCKIGDDMVQRRSENRDVCTES